MALQSAKHESIHSKTGGALAKLKAKFDEGLHTSLVIDQPDDQPLLTAAFYQMQKMQDEINYLRTEISDNKDNRINIGSSTTISFGDMITTTTTKKGVTTTTYTIVMTVTNGGVSKAITLTLS